jgi:uncharacterized protein (TIGR00251 family)
MGVICYFGGMMLRVKVKPNSRTDEVTVEPDGTIKVRIKAPPVEGKANKYLVEYLAKYLGLSRSKVTLLKGETNQYKTLEIDAPEEVVMGKIGAKKD